jgi:hypothetical protein
MFTPPLTEEDKMNIEQIKMNSGKGFFNIFNIFICYFIDHISVIPAYLTCDKNIELTLLYLSDKYVKQNKQK